MKVTAPTQTAISIKLSTKELPFLVFLFASLFLCHFFYLYFIFAGWGFLYGFSILFEMPFRTLSTIFCALFKMKLSFFCVVDLNKSQLPITPDQHNYIN